MSRAYRVPAHTRNPAGPTLVSLRGLLRVALALTCLPLLACDLQLLEDSSFDVWCGEELCDPWNSEGQIKRVGSWHESDFAVSLESGGAEVSQVLLAGVECFNLSLVADITADADVRIELDYFDDGRIEWSQNIPGTSWEPVEYYIHGPEPSRKTRLRIKKHGTGRALIAAVAVYGRPLGCPGKPFDITPQENGARCASDATCDSRCVSRPADPDVDLADYIANEYPSVRPELRDLYGNREEGLTPLHLVCGECESSQDCEDGNVCAPTDRGHVCVEPRELGQTCDRTEQCAEGLCAPPPGQAADADYRGTAGRCAVCPETCDGSEVCGLATSADAEHRLTCVQRAGRMHGERCASNVECGEGVCCNGRCSSCCGGGGCEVGETCVTAPTPSNLYPYDCAVTD